MAWFTKKEWKNRLAEFAGRRTLTDVATGASQVVDVARNEGTISQEGDAFSAANMNEFEQRILEGFTQAENATTELNQNISALNSSGAITGMSAGEDGVYITYVPSAGADPVTKKLGEAEMVLLWTNPNSASSKFAGQTVSVDLSDYTYVVITQYASDQLTYTSDVIIPVGSTGNSGGVYNRTIKVTTSGITFSNAANGTYPTAYNIPRYIYGLG